MVYRMFFLGRKFVSVLFCSLKFKNPKNVKTLKLLPNLGFFPAVP